MVLVSERRDLLGIFGDLQSQFFFSLSERTPHQSSRQYERMFHRGTLPREKKKKKKRKLSQKFNFPAKIKFWEKLLFNKKSVRHFLFCYLLWKTFKSLSTKLLRHRYSECIKAFVVAYWGGGMLDIPKAHTYMCTWKHIHTHICTRSHNHKQAENWFRQLNIWHLTTWAVSNSAARGPEKEQLGLSCSSMTLILMFKQIQSIDRWHSM